MTSDETGVDAVEAAAVIRPLVRTVEGCAIDGGYQPSTGGGLSLLDLSDRIIGLLADAHLLADPADRDAWEATIRVLRDARRDAEAERDHAKAAAADHYAMALKCSEEALAVAGKLSAEQEANEALREQLGVEVRSREQWESNAERAEAEVARLSMAKANQRQAETEAAQAVADLATAEAEVARLHSWDGLLELLDEHWPEDIFPTLPDDQSRDPGPRIASLIRWVTELEHRLACPLDELTGGRMSKTNYDVRTMVQEVEAYFERTEDDEVTELRATVERCKALADHLLATGSLLTTNGSIGVRIDAAIGGGEQS